MNPAARTADGDQLVRLLECCAADGHTLTPLRLAVAVLGGRGLRLEAALRDVGPTGLALVDQPFEQAIGLRALVDAERLIARVVLERVSRDRLRLVVGRAGDARRLAAEKLAGASAVALADDAECLDVETLAVLLDAADDEMVVLAGDLDTLDPVGAGRGFADIAAAALVEPLVVCETPDGPLDAIRVAVRHGDLPVIEDQSRQVVVVGAGSAADVLRRVEQLVTDSIPRVIGIEPSGIQVVGVEHAGPAGTRALGDLLARVAPDAPPPLTAAEAAGRRWPAVVAVFAPRSGGLLSRALVCSAIDGAERHLSIVQASGSALAHAVRLVPRRPRHTLLPHLLANR